MLLLRVVPLLIPKSQYSFLNLSSEIAGQLNGKCPFAIVGLKRSFWHLNESLLAFRLNDLYMRNADEVADNHCRETSK